MLSDALKTLSASPTAGEKKQALAAVNGQIVVLESQLGIKARLMPIFNADRAVKRLAELQGQLAAKGLTTAPTPAAVASAIAAAIPAVPGDGGIVATLAQWKGFDAATRLQFAQDGGSLAQADFNQLSALAKMHHCRAGGKILGISAPSDRIVAPGHVAVTPAPVKL